MEITAQQPLANDYLDAVEARLAGLTAVSTGICPGCEQCRDAYAADCAMDEFYAQWQAGEVDASPAFSWLACDICGCLLGGDREPWHAVDSDGTLIHGDHACTVCVSYLANGDVPKMSHA